jgi:hypothetical protein
MREVDNVLVARVPWDSRDGASVPSIEELLAERERANALNGRLQSQLMRYQDRVVELRDALAWYANPDVWRVPMLVEMDNAGDTPTSDAQADEGERARTALEACPQ